MKTSFSNADLAEILGKPSRFIIEWSELGLIEADIVPATGPGSRRRYSYKAILRAALGLHLKERYGLQRNLIKEILDKLSDIDFFTDWSSGFIKTQKEFSEKQLSNLRTTNVGDELQRALETKLQDKSFSPINKCCLSLFYFKNLDYTWGIYPLKTLKEVNPHFQIDDMEKDGGEVKGIITVDFGFIKMGVDENIAALT